MRILVACEESQAVTKELRKLGHEAYSCDILETSGENPEWHIMQDVIPLVNGNCTFNTCDGKIHSIEGKWDMLIAFPPCTHLATSGAKHFAKKRANGRQREGIEFFCKFIEADCPKKAIENPMGIMSGGAYIKTHYPDLVEKYKLPIAYTQTIQPWWFAADENDTENYHEKTTCLWLFGLEPLKAPLQGLKRPEGFITSTGVRFPSWYSKTSLRGKGNRSKVRSKTFPGIAKAMALQWAGENKAQENEEREIV